MQFAIGAQFIAVIYAAISISTLLSQIKIKFAGTLITVIILMLTATRAVHEGMQNFTWIPGRQELYIPPAELAAIDKLKQLPKNGLVLMPEPWAKEQFKLALRFLTDQHFYVTGYLGVLYDHNITEGLDRLNEAKRLYTLTGDQELGRALTDLNIRYSYAPLNKQLNLIPVYTNDQVSIVEYRL
jgi:hypothetical protein